MANDFLSRMRADLAEPEQTRKLNRALFALIAPRYDHATRFLSLGRDAYWKNRLIASLPHGQSPVCIDLACGTGDLTRRLASKYPNGTVIGLDLTEAMLSQARLGHLPHNLRYVVGDMGHTGLSDNSVDLVTGSYALRSAGDLHEALSEVHRILKPGGVAVFLDFSKSVNPRLQRITLAILKWWGSLWGWMLHRDPRVYAYIAASLARYPDRHQLATLFRETGFEVRHTRHAFLGLIECVMVGKK